MYLETVLYYEPGLDMIWFSYIYRSQCRSMQENGDVLHPNRFGLLLRNAGAVGDVRDCPVSVKP